MKAGLVSSETPPWFTDGLLLAVSSRGASSMRAPLVSFCVSKVPLPIRTPVRLD